MVNSVSAFLSTLCRSALSLTLMGFDVHEGLSNDIEPSSANLWPLLALTASPCSKWHCCSLWRLRSTHRRYLTFCFTINIYYQLFLTSLALKKKLLHLFRSENSLQRKCMLLNSIPSKLHGSLEFVQVRHRHRQFSPFSTA
jgi:hypothetical protein